MRINSFNEKKNRRPWIWGLLLGCSVAFVLFGNEIFLQFENNSPSRSFGAHSKGHIESAKRLPTSGPNFVAYSRLGAALGRNSVHHKLRQTILESYASVYQSNPKYTFVYGETGWPWGGNFWPHRTHQNGLSVDFFVPVLEGETPKTFPHSVWRGWGYRNEFDSEGKMDAYSIDFDAMIVHLNAVKKAAKNNGVRIKRVLFSPKLQKLLKAKKGGKKLLKALKFAKADHSMIYDEHYHIDFY